MRRSVALLSALFLAGALAGSLATRWYDGREPPAQRQVVRDLVATPTMPTAVAEKHRSENYRSLDTVPAIFELPTAFARSEALYALAGRSDAAALQQQIFAADRIADEVEREHSLNILFFRLAELDPESALALARTDYFRGTRSIADAVWSAWARKDFDGALFAAKTQVTAAAQNDAAQSLFAAFGHTGNELTERIEQELGIGPDRLNRARYLYRMADRSWEEARRYVDSLEGLDRHRQAGWLADYLARRDPAAARRYLASVEDLQLRQTIGHQLMTALAEESPLTALAWARDNTREFDERGSLEMMALGELAIHEPELAFAEAMRTAEDGNRSHLLQIVLSTIAQNDPELAVSLMERLEDPASRDNARLQVAATWMMKDPDAAMRWIENHEPETASQLINQAGAALIYTDVDRAIELLPRVEQSQDQGWRIQIAAQLATARSVEEALDFVRRFEGEPDYADLQSIVIAEVAQTDSDKAHRFADQIADSHGRDAAYYQILQHHSEPEVAVTLLPEIVDEGTRGRAAASLAQQWLRKEPQAANRWILQLPPGQLRDLVVNSSIHMTDDVDPDVLRLVGEIEDPGLRAQTKAALIYQVANTDPAGARQRLDSDPDIADDLRAELEAYLEQLGY